MAGQPYTAEYRDSLTTGTWSTLTNVNPQASNTDVPVTDPTHSESAILPGDDDILTASGNCEESIATVIDRRYRSVEMAGEFPKAEIETLWAPWRVEYFEKEPRNSNFLAEAATASDDAAHPLSRGERRRF